MLINETQLPHLKVKPENLERHLKAADQHRIAAHKGRDGRHITITYNERKGYEGDLFILPEVGLVALIEVMPYGYQDMIRMAGEVHRHEGFVTERQYLTELIRCYPELPNAFYVHTFLEINRRSADD